VKGGRGWGFTLFFPLSLLGGVLSGLQVSSSFGALF